MNEVISTIKNSIIGIASKEATGKIIFAACIPLILLLVKLSADWYKNRTEFSFRHHADPFEKLSLQQFAEIPKQEETVGRVKMIYRIVIALVLCLSVLMIAAFIKKLNN